MEKLLKQRADPLLMKGLNAHALLMLLRTHGELSRSGLSRLSRLSKPTVSDQVAGLIAQGIVSEAGAGAVGSQGGKTPTLLRLNPEFGRVVAIEIRSTGLRLRATNLAGAVVADRLVATTDLGAKAVTRALMQAVAALIESPGAPIRILCIAAPGVVDAAAGTVLETDNVFGWRNVPLRALLSRKFQLPVVVENDVNLAALAELDSGGADGENETAVLVELDAGIGAGAVINGRLHRGVHWAAGEIAHMAFGPLLLPQGQERLRGQLETAVGMEAIATRIRGIGAHSPLLHELLERLPPVMALAEAAQLGDEAAESYVAELSQLLGVVLANLSACYDPGRIILLGEPFAPLLPRIRRVFEVLIRWPVELRLSRLGADAVLKGAELAGLAAIFESCALAAGRNGDV